MNNKVLISKKRKERDILKLVTAGYKVNRSESDSNQLSIFFKGPENTFYENGEWSISIFLPHEYPFKSPSIGFIEKIYHPNIDYLSGSICLDVINQKWSPMFELVNIFDVFLPQLLLYPNISDPLNIEAAKLYSTNIKKYEDQVKKIVNLYASKKTQSNSVLLQNHKTSLNFDISDTLSNQSELSELSETSDICLEEDLF
jgi:ubiquitin-conjugating enzyme E2 H